jgi:hypothetical protein
VRVVLAVFDDEGKPPEELCKAFGGLSRVFLFTWTAQGVIHGFDQWGLAARLTRGSGGSRPAPNRRPRCSTRCSGCGADA